MDDFDFIKHREEAKKLFLPKVIKRISPEMLETHIVNIEYVENSLGFRCNEFNRVDNDKKILFLGCSHTYGFGLPQDQTFPDILSKNLNLNLVNLSCPGDSAMSQIRKAFWYFREFGNPKIIVATFPVNRMETVVVPGKNQKNPFNSFYDTETIYPRLNTFQKYSKAPYNLENIFAADLSLYYTFVFINMLDQYCRSNDIKLFIAVWQIQDYIHEIVKDIDLPYKDNFYYIKSLSHNFNKGSIDCHKEIENKKLFYEAADRDPDPERYDPHWGIHQNLHIAEDWYNIITNGGTNELHT